MSIEFDAALNLPLPQLAEALTEAFHGYFMEVHFTSQGVGQMVRCDSVDLGASLCALIDGRPVGVALIARRGWTSRLAAMGIAEEARGQGIGRQMMRRLIVDAGERGQRTMTLEVIEQNSAALHLYESAGFRIVRRLVGYTTEPVRANEETLDEEDYGGLEEADMRSVARSLIAHGHDDLPWQLSGETLAQQGPPNRAFRLETAYAAISNPENSQVAIRAIGDSLAEQSQRNEAWLLHALMAKYPGKIWKAPPIYPEETAPTLFEPLGFRRETLTQLQMVRDL